jgi:hypothetical protein
MTNENQKSKPEPEKAELPGPPCSLRFGDLTTGDRFLNEHGVLWTKLAYDRARKHSDESNALGMRGYGFRDSICTFGDWEAVQFVPANVKARHAS